MNILLTEDSLNNKEFRHFESSLSPNKNNFIHRLDSYKKNFKNELKFNINPLSKSLNGNLSKERQLIKDNFISIKQKINQIKDSVVNDKRFSTNRNLFNIEKRSLLEELMIAKNTKLITNINNINTKVVSNRKEMDVINEEVELKNKYYKLNDNADNALEEKLINLKNKLKIKNSINDQLNTMINMSKTDNFEKLLNKSISKDKKLTKTLNSIKKVRKYSSNDPMNNIESKYIM